MFKDCLKLVATLFLALSICPNASATDSDGGDKTTYQFSVGVDLVSLSLTVMDPRQQLVTDLALDDFAVYEDGVQQEIEFFSRDDLPLRMVILLDTSASMIPKMSIAQQAAIRFVRSLKPEDSVQVMEFSDRVLTLVDFTSNYDRVVRAIEKTMPGGDTSLHDSLYVSLKDLSTRREGAERQAIVVLTDGADTDSMVTFDDVRELARKTDALIYSVCLFGSEQDLEQDGILEAKYELYKLAEETGGAAYTVERPDDLAGTYERIATELKKQYHLSYLSTQGDADGAWRRIQVLCDRTNVQLRTRAGYYARKARRRAGTR